MTQYEYKQALRIIQDLTNQLTDLAEQFCIDPHCLDRELRSLSILQDTLTNAYIAED